jgi:hypothetical protein
MRFDLSEVVTAALAQLPGAGRDEDAIRAVFDDAAAEVVRRVHDRYPSTSGPRMQQALLHPEECPPDYPQARAWSTGRDALAELKRAIAAAVGDPLAETACGDPYQRLRYLCDPAPWASGQPER